MYKPKLFFPYIILFISLIFAFFLYPEVKYTSINNSKVNTCTFLALFNSIIFLRTTNKFIKTWVRFDFFFILSYLIVHFQIVFFYTFFNSEPTRWDFWTSKLTVNYGIWLSTFVLLIFMLGTYFCLSINSRKVKKLKKVTAPKYNLKLLGYVDYLILIFLVLFSVFVGSAFWSGAYLGTANWGAGTTYIFLVLRTLITLRVIYFFVLNQNIFSSSKRLFNVLFFNKILVFSVFFYILVFLIQGDRGPVMQLGLMIAGAYTIFEKNVSFIKIFIAIISAAFIFTIIGLGRSSEVENIESDIFSQGYDKLQSSSDTVIPTDELAWSGSILFQAIDLNRDGGAMLKGITLINNLIGVIPMSTLFYKPPKLIKSSTNFFTHVYKGPEAKFGVGSEIIADLYINLGVIATIVIFFIFGYFTSFISLEAHLFKSNFYILLIYLTLLSLSIYLNRANFLNPLKYIFYLVLFHKLLTWRQRK